MSNTARKFDALDYANELKKVGFSEDQANLQAKALFSIVEEQLLTKQDLQELEAKVNYGFQDIKRDLQDVKRDIKESELRLIVRLTGIITLVVGGIGAVLKFLPTAHL